jgi:acid phosphatase
VDKLVVFVVENHSLNQMRQGMPWLYDLGRQYGYAAGYAAVTHPSMPNYLAIASGSTFGIADDNPPADHAVAGSSVFGSALAAGRTATVYADGMDTPCKQSDGGTYAVRHNPWTYFGDERQACLQHDVPMQQLAADVSAGRLPNVGMVVPDTCHDAHDCSLSQADDWLRTEVENILHGPDWMTGRLAVVITADEDDHHQNNLVLTVVAHPFLEHTVVTAPLSHYSVARAYAEVGGFRPMQQAKKAPSLLGAFGLVATR